MSETPDQHPVNAPRRASGTFGPHVPYLTPGEHIDRGPAGSLRQQLARLRAGRKPIRWRWSLGLQIGTVVLCVAALAVLHKNVWLAGTLFAIALVSTSVGALLHGDPRLLVPGRGSPALQLAQRIRVEVATAKTLDHLRSDGWEVLHDRLLPGTEHRLPHVLIGSAGVFIIGELPPYGPPSMRDGILYAGAEPLSEWVNTRWWETEQLQAYLESVVERWQGPTFPLIVLPGTPKVAMPGHVQNVTIRPIAGILPLVRSLPAPLGRLAATDLAETVRDACLPAATKDEF